MNDSRLRALSALSGGYFESGTGVGNQQEEERLTRRIKKIYQNMEGVDGTIDEIIRKPFAVDESPIKTLNSTMGRKDP